MAMKKLLYFLIQITWGSLQSVAGLFIFLLNINNKHYFYHGAVVTEWSNTSSVSLGLFLFISTRKLYDRRGENGLKQEETSRALLVHEYGHTIQSLVLGPLYLPVIGIASALWANHPRYRKRRMKGAAYSSFWTEHSANMLGEKITKEKSLEDVVL